MKRKVMCALSLFAVFFGFLTVMLIISEREAGQIRDGVLRLHIVANSDSESDQQNKMSVRDGIAQLCSQLFYSSDSKAQAMESARQNGDVIVAKAEEILKSRGSDDSVRVTVRQRFFPTRTYEGVSLPAGVYDTVDVEIGSAAGKNFWCVMFPDICVGASDADGNKEKMSDVLTGGALEMTTDTEETSVKFRFAIVEIFENIKHFFGVE